MMLRKTKLRVVCYVLIIAFILPMLLSATAPQVVAEPDWLSGWEDGWRMKITIDHTKVDADLDNFPVLVYLDSTYTDFWSHCDSETNIAFTLSDGTTKLKRDIELFDHTNDNLYAHIKVPDLSSTVDTDIYIYYDSTSHGQTNDADTWDDNFVMVQHMKDSGTGGGVSLIDEPDNPVINPGAESSLIMDGEQCDAWYSMPYGNYTQLYYAYATDNSCKTFTQYESNPVLTGLRFPFILKENNTYYLFSMKAGLFPHGDLYLWSSDNKTTWTPMNDGDPVFTCSSDTESQYYLLWNPGVVVVDGIWHLFIECAPDGVGQEGVGLGYSYSNLENLNWDTYRAEGKVIDKGGSPTPIYVSDKNSIMVLYGKLDPLWDIKASYASLGDNLALASSWHEGPGFDISYSGKHTADPSFVVAGPSKDHNIIIQFFYNQQSTYQKYSALSLNDFFDAIKQTPTVDLTDSTSNNNDGTKASVDNPIENDGKIWKAQDFSSDYIDFGTSSTLKPTSAITLEAWTKCDTTTPQLFSSRNPTNNYQLYYNAGKYYVLLWGLTTISLESTASVSTTNWQHVVVTYDGSYIRFYIDGSPSGSVSSSGSISAGDDSLWMGSDHYGTYHDGKMDEARVSNIARSADWSKTTFNNQSSPSTFYLVGSEESYSPSGVAPNPPTSLLCEGQTNPTKITDLTPEFSAVGTDNDGDQMNYYTLQVDDDSAFGSPIYDKAKTAITAFDNNTRCPDISYENSDLARGTTYYWHIKFWDNNNNEGAWSTESATFKINQLPTCSPSVTPASPHTTDNLTCTANESDSDGDSVTCSYQWYEDGVLMDGETENTLNSSKTTKDNAYKCLVTPYDGYEYGSATYSNEITVLNTTPNPPSMTSDFGVVTNQHPTVTWTKGTDDDGDTINTYVYVGTSPSPTTEENHNEGTSLDIGYTVHLENDNTYYVRLRSHDGYEYSSYTPDDEFTTNFGAEEEPPDDGNGNGSSSTTRRLTVTVLDNETDMPIEGVRVELHKGGALVENSCTRWDGQAVLDIKVLGVYDLRWTKEGYETEVMEIELNVSSELTLRMVPVEGKAEFPLQYLAATLIVGCVLMAVVRKIGKGGGAETGGKEAGTATLIVVLILPSLVLGLLWFVGAV